MVDVPRRVAIALPLCLVVAACGSADQDSATGGSAGGDRLVVAAAFYPIEEVVTRVGGAAVDVVGLVPPGQPAHDHELTPSQLEALGASDVVFYLGSGFQPSVEKAVDALPDDVVTVDLLESVTLLAVTPTLAGVDGETDGETLADGTDPHVWLDPANMQRLAKTVATTLAAAAPDRATTFTDGAETYGAALHTLDTEFAEGLRSCASRVIVTSHRAFEYLARRYDLRQLPIAGISPDEEPSARTLEAIAAEAAAEGVQVIFFEENLPADLSETVAAEIGASVDVLDPVEGLTDEQLAAGEDYVTIMRTNLAALQRGLGCS